MNISSVAASTPATTVDASPPKTVDVTADGGNDDAGAAQPTIVAALPPGQGTRIDQLV